MAWQSIGFPEFAKPRLAAFAQARGWSAEELLSAETKNHERLFRPRERLKNRFHSAVDSPRNSRDVRVLNL
jgi:hypothetical protein